jgi:lysozyme
MSTIKFTLRAGNKGQEVKRLQCHLGTGADGDFGPITDAAVRNYQSLHGLTVDGIAGSQTLGHLNIAVLSGIDVSAWNGTINWKKVANSGVKYSWVKVTEGRTHTNRPYKQNIDGCHQNGIAVGGYHFGRPDTGIEQGAKKDAVAEAQYFLSKLCPLLLPGDLLPVLDVEAGMKTDDQHNVDWCLAWLEYVEDELGARPLVYTGGWSVDLFLRKASSSSLSELAKYPLWWARYLTPVDGTAMDPENSSKMLPWDEWAVWQWTHKGVIDGIKGKVDRNWMAGGKLSSLLIP